jgi:thiol:disulfide interchange protein DsbA
MRRTTFLVGLLAGALPLQVLAAASWTEGVQYSRIQQSEPTALPAGQVEVTEVFSYGCPYCNAFVPTADAIKASLPPNAKMDYLPASFSTAEDFPMFQRAFFTAQALGMADRMHDAMFDAVWKTGELAIENPQTHQIRNPLPTLADVARFYQRHTGIPAAKFLATAHSFWVESKIANCDALVRAYQVDGTPCIIVNGKYRVNMQALHSYQEVVQLVDWLVQQERRDTRAGIQALVSGKVLSEVSTLLPLPP